MAGLPRNETEGRGVRGAERFYGLSEMEAERWRAIIHNGIVRMLQVTDITEREEVRRAWETISDLGRKQAVDDEHVLQVLALVGGSAPRIPLLGKVWGIINLCEASQNLSAQQTELARKIQSTLGDVIITEPDQTKVSQNILLGAWIAGLAYSEDDESRAERFMELSANVDKKNPQPYNRWGMQVAARLLTELMDADRLRMGILTVDIQGGDQQKSAEYTGKDLRAGWPDTIMILRQGAMHSKEKLKEGVGVGVPTAGDLLVRRTLKVMVGLERELLDPAATRILEYPDRRWSFMTPGAYMHSEQSVQWAKGEFMVDGLTLWVALQGIESLKGKIVPPVQIQNGVARAVRRLEERISLLRHDGTIENAPSVLKTAVNEWNENHGANISFEAASKQLTDSALGLVLAAGEPKEGDYFVSGRPEIFAAYKQRLWETLSLEDKLAFVQILYREGSPKRRELSRLDQAVFPLVIDPSLWDQQTPEEQQAIVTALFEAEGSTYGRELSQKQQQLLRTSQGEERVRRRFMNVQSDIERVRSKLIAQVGQEIVIKAETIRDKAGEPGEAVKGDAAVVVFNEKEGV